MKKPVTMTIEENVLEAAKNKAKQDRRSLSEFVSMKLEEILELRPIRKNTTQPELKRRGNK